MLRYEENTLRRVSDGMTRNITEALVKPPLKSDEKKFYLYQRICGK